MINTQIITYTKTNFLKSELYTSGLFIRFFELLEQQYEFVIIFATDHTASNWFDICHISKTLEHNVIEQFNLQTIRLSSIRFIALATSDEQATLIKLTYS